MAIKKRSSPAERVAKLLGPKWKDGLQHWLVKKALYGSPIDTSDVSVADIIAKVRGVKGATWQEKAFVFALSSVLWRAYGYELISDPQFDRLRKHLIDNFQKIVEAGHAGAAHIALWDEPKIAIFGKDDMILRTLGSTVVKPKVKRKPKIKPKPKAKVKPKPKRKKLAK